MASCIQQRMARLALFVACGLLVAQAKDISSLPSQQAKSSDNGTSFLRGQVQLEMQGKSVPMHHQDRVAFQKEIRTAVKSAFGLGRPIKNERLASTRVALLPMWEALPKNTFGRVDRRVLRYVGHRYFLRRFGIWVRGLEPTLAANHSSGGVAEILSQQVPWYVEATLESHLAAVHGFSIEDAVYMIVAIEELIFDSEATLLEHIYKDESIAVSKLLKFEDLRLIIGQYILHWFVGERIHSDGPWSVLHNLTFILDSKSNMRLPDWMLYLLDFVNGQVQSYQWLRQHGSQKVRSEAADIFKMQYSFNDAHQIVAEITRSFGSFWESECLKLKDALVEVDRHNTGRVPLSRFYGAGTAYMQDHHFTESTAYLQELGALDATSALWGKQVIIPNYLQSAANCVATTPHYRMCCFNECERIMDQIEAAIGSSSATPAQLVEVVQNLSVQTTLDDDGLVIVEGNLVALLERIASENHGQVQLHGRLFSQWLHYAFPRECPFPHKAGTVVHKSPHEFGNVSNLPTEVRQRHVADPLEKFAMETFDSMPKEELEWMSQWSFEEELVVQVGGDLPWPSSRNHVGLITFVIVFLLVLRVSWLFPCSGSEPNGLNKKYYV